MIDLRKLNNDYYINKDIVYIGENPENTNFKNVLHSISSDSKMYEITTYLFRTVDMDMGNAFGSPEHTAYKLSVRYGDQIVLQKTMSTDNSYLNKTDIEDYLNLVGNNYSRIIQTITKTRQYLLQ